MGFTEVFDLIILGLGLAITVYGLVVWIGKKPKLTLDYNWEKVKEEEIKSFTTAYGISYSLMGVLMTLLAVSRIFFEGQYKGLIFILYFIAYFIFMYVTKRIRRRFTGSD
ncbi:MAG: hypothetical protein GX129_06575 [Clostridiales bacterium]|jgi:hypothetical protein|nr:hypothetical protein [Clostridiales bacterium]